MKRISARFGRPSTELTKPSEAIEQHTSPPPAEVLRVVEVIATDFVWSDKHAGFFPVFGSVHGDRAAPPPARPIPGTAEVIRERRLDRPVAGLLETTCEESDD